MILVDTSVLIDYLKGTENPPARAFHSILEKKIPYGIHDVIYLEVLQGSKSENDLFLLHNDEDFARISAHFPLKIWKIGLE